MTHRWFLAVLAFAMTNPAIAEDIFVGTPRQTICIEGEGAMHLPTDVAVSRDGAVYVADGVNDRVVVFSPSGALQQEIRSAGDRSLHRPVGVHCGLSGRLLVADTGNQRVVVFAADGAFERAIPAPEPGRNSPDITDAVEEIDGKTIWIADNDSDRLGVYDLDSGAWRIVGRGGESLGQFTFPFLLSVAANGDVAVTDVINGRVQLLDRTERVIRAIGQFGVERGELYRPKGIAFDPAGNVWVSDSVTGVVQVFGADGSFGDALRGEDGKPLHFETPVGLAIDSSGSLYIVEQLLNRVQVLSIAAPPRLPLKALPQPRIGGTERQGRTCTVCHMEWLQPLAEGRSTELIVPPKSTPDQPAVSLQTSCLSCHDGSVGDARRRVWLQHGHRTGVEPPDNIRVPANLPLVDGKLACRTCHSAHGQAVPDADIRRAIVLRMPNTNSELCKSCHTDKLGGPRFGTHPTGGMPWSVPQALLDAGAKMGRDPRELTCQVCHSPHGAAFDHLLVMGTGSNQLCLTCHEQMRPGMFREGGAEHPLRPKVNAAQAAAINDLGTRLGTGGTLVCLSCHKLHHGKGERFLLAEDLKEGRLCLRCHADKTTVLDTPHDLRGSAPDERNRLGATVAQTGVCSACHLFHRFARDTRPSAVDPTGECVSCHSAGQIAEKKQLTAWNHPTLGCVNCHNPHRHDTGKFLRSGPDGLCLGCHADKAGVRGGSHDACVRIEPFAARNALEADRCLACHRPHGDEEHQLWRVAPDAEASLEDAPCLGCHADARWRSDSNHAALHPREGRLPDYAAAGLPPTSTGTAVSVRLDADGRMQLACRTCHNPHAGPASGVALLRAPRGQESQLCGQCHREVNMISQTRHSPASLASAGLEGGGCKPCHALHGNPDAVMPERLWPRTLLAAGGMPDSAESVGDVLCLGCHREGGAAPWPGAATHPVVQMFNALGSAPDALPLFSKSGHQDAEGFIRCRTCHLPHGREIAGPASDAATSGGADAMPGSRLQLRPFSAPNVCTTCHGADGMRRFLYFHDAQRRGGGLIAGTAERTARN
ncbi:MAG: cytochrome c3 family protein [Phycisphaerae bacterium]